MQLERKDPVRRGRQWTKRNNIDFAPHDTPRDIIDKLNTAAVNTLHDPNIRQKLEARGFEIPPREQQTPEALGAYQKAEIEKWWPIIKAEGIQAE